MISGVAYTALFITIFVLIIALSIAFIISTNNTIIANEIRQLEIQFSIQLIDVPLTQSSPLTYTISSGATAYTLTGTPPIDIEVFTVVITTAVAAVGRPFYIINSTNSTITVLVDLESGVNWVNSIIFVSLHPDSTAAFIYATSTTVEFVDIGNNADTVSINTSGNIDSPICKDINPQKHQLVKGLTPQRRRKHKRFY